MIKIQIWTFWSLNALAIIAVIFFQKRNARLLSAGEIKEKARILSEENSLTRWQNWSFLAVSTVLVTSNLLFAADIPIKYFFYLIITHLTYTAFRNRQIFRRINLPEEYISREFALGILTVLLLVLDIFYIF
ncbi:MAG: hypothetical protein ABI686_13650 [Acidobacteriota bacterium]